MSPSREHLTAAFKAIDRVSSRFGCTLSPTEHAQLTLGLYDLFANGTAVVMAEAWATAQLTSAGYRCDLLAELEAEIARANQLHPKPYNSSHEAYAVLQEEVDEFWGEVCKKSSERSPGAMRAELIQVAAVAMRAIKDLGLRAPS